MDDNDNPALNPIFEGRDLTPLLTSSTQAEQPSTEKNVHPAIGKIVSEIGLRYRPAAQADLVAHGHALRLLTEDLADVPISILETAAKRWVREKKFMPRAAELIALAREVVSDKTRGTDFALDNLQRHCDGLNELAWVRGSGRRWQVLGTAPKRFCAPVDSYGRVAG